MGFKEAIEAMHDKAGVKAKGVDIAKVSTKGETLVEVFAKELGVSDPKVVDRAKEIVGSLEAVMPRVEQLDEHLRNAPMGAAVPAPAPAVGPFASEEALLQAWEALKTRLNGPRPFKGESTVTACSKRVNHLGRGLWELQAVLASPGMSNKAHYHKLAMEIAAQVDEMAEEAERRRPEGDEWAAIRTRLAELKRIALAIPVPASEPALKPTSELFARDDAPDTSTLRCPCGSEFTWTLADPGLEPWIQAHHAHTLFTRCNDTNKSSSLKCPCGSTYTWVDPHTVPWEDPWVEQHRPHALAAKMAKIHMAKAQAKAKALAAPFVDTDSIISTIPKAEDLPPMPKMVEGPDAGYDQIWSTIKGTSRRLDGLLQAESPTREKDIREVHARLNGLLPVIAWMQGCSRQPATWAELATTAESMMRTASGALTPTRFETALAAPVDVDAAPPKDPKGTNFVLTRTEALEKVQALELALAERTAERDQARRELAAARQALRTLYGKAGEYGKAGDYGIDPEEVERLRSLGYHVAVVNAPKVPDEAKDAAVDTPPPANNQERVRRLVNAFEDIVQTPPDPTGPPYPAEKTVGRYARATMATPAKYPPAVPATLQKLLSEKQVYEAPTATPMNETQVAILAECDALAAMLLKKNKSYGNSALDPVRIFSRASAREQILVRLDDKLSRLSRAGGDHLGEDVILDILGYLILLRVQTRLGSTP